MDHNDILFAMSEPLDIVSAVAARVKELRPDWDAYNEYPGFVLIDVKEHDQHFCCGTVNETWDGDYYANWDAHNPEGGFKTGLEGSCTDVEKIALRLEKEVADYLDGREHRKDFLAAMEKFRQAAYALSASYDDLNEDDNFATAEEFPFSDSFDEVAAEIDSWAESVKKAFGSKE